MEMEIDVSPAADLSTTRICWNQRVTGFPIPSAGVWAGRLAGGGAIAAGLLLLLPLRWG
jgi:hypothetical protein